jgi:hypothetical protein
MISQLTESNSMISETRQPFARRHNASCVYYGIRGNARSQYLWDKSCVFDGADLGITALEPGYAMPLGAEMPVLLSQGHMTILGDEMPTLLGEGPTRFAGDLDALQRFLQLLNDNSVARVYTSKSGTGFASGVIPGATLGSSIPFIVVPTALWDAVQRAWSCKGMLRSS